MHTASRRIRITFAALMVLMLSVGVVQPTTGALPRVVRERAIPATVKIYSLDDNMKITGWGSGSIIAQTGQVLTNNHVVADPQSGKLENKNGIVAIAITTDPRKPANAAYLGKVIRNDPTLDLALVSVASDISGSDLAGCLKLPTYDVGDSDMMMPGDPIAVIGFPGIGGEAVTYTEGIISGFDGTPEEPWLKTDAEVNRGNSGGSAIDEDGRLIGVPSAVNSDAKTAGRISLIRPINVARTITADADTLAVPGCNGAAPFPGGSPGVSPDEPSASASSAAVIGRVLSADTGRPIPDAVFVVLTPGINWDTVDLDNPEHILSVARTDMNGAFQTEGAFDRDQRYSMGVAADGFAPAMFVDVDLNRLEPAGEGFVNAGDVTLKAR